MKLHKRRSSDLMRSLMLVVSPGIGFCTPSLDIGILRMVDTGPHFPTTVIV